MKLTRMAKMFITLVVLAVIGYTGWHYFKNEMRCWSSPETCAADTTGTKTTGGDTKGVVKDDKSITKDDFSGIANSPKDPDKGGVTGVTAAAVTGNKLDRPLRVASNTWA